ncbi:hypothetical protein CROQUDRAFT_97610 [Cronartium quercuum f. sp. fusiforme G11]|uniref:Uncharacterized protein n=1 Tax=Cronartium quercuum f. sp. fusiforme G11 TaxID=708437 RepID=A0A9P6NEV4_9BASI|nr:hypothetical protein CROQUDRAFT_97610 [Cronartium quercuum f. sp. fusiforme G11]
MIRVDGIYTSNPERIVSYRTHASGKVPDLKFEADEFRRRQMHPVELRCVLSPAYARSSAAVTARVASLADTISLPALSWRVTTQTHHPVKVLPACFNLSQEYLSALTVDFSKDKLQSFAGEVDYNTSVLLFSGPCWPVFVATLLTRVLVDDPAHREARKRARSGHLSTQDRSLSTKRLLASLQMIDDKILYDLWSAGDGATFPTLLSQISDSTCPLSDKAEEGKDSTESPQRKRYLGLADRFPIPSRLRLSNG